MICSICGKHFNDKFGNNASPFKGRCCNECNIKKVVPIRYCLMKGYAILFDISNHEIKSITNPETFECEDLQKFVEGYFEVIDLNNGYVAICNEEGKLKNLPENTLWSMFEMSNLCVPLVGNVLLMRKEQLK